MMPNELLLQRILTRVHAMESDSLYYFSLSTKECWPSVSCVRESLLVQIKFTIEAHSLETNVKICAIAICKHMNQDHSLEH